MLNHEWVSSDCLSDIRSVSSYLVRVHALRGLICHGHKHTATQNQPKSSHTCIIVGDRNVVCGVCLWKLSPNRNMLHFYKDFQQHYHVRIFQAGSKSPGGKDSTAGPHIPKASK